MSRKRVDCCAATHRADQGIDFFAETIGSDRAPFTLSKRVTLGDAPVFSDGKKLASVAKCP